MACTVLPNEPASTQTTMPPRPSAQSRPLVSVIIPTYNRAALCSRAVRSVLAQTYEPIEVIVVDDGSTDGTADAITSEFGDSVILLRQGNSGVSAARNAGMARARGRYMALLDSDDLWEPHKLTQQVDWLQTHPDFGMVLCNLAVRDLDGSDAGIIDRRPRLPRDGEILGDVVRNPSLVPSTVLIRREVYEQLGGFDPGLRTAEDLDFHMRVAARFKIGLLPAALAIITKGDEEGLSELPCTTSDHVHVVSRFVRNNKGLIAAEDAHMAMFQVLTYNAWSAAASGRPAEALGHTLNALRHVSRASQLRAVLALVPTIVKATAKVALDALR